MTYNILVLLSTSIYLSSNPIWVGQPTPTLSLDGTFVIYNCPPKMLMTIENNLFTTSFLPIISRLCRNLNRDLGSRQHYTSINTQHHCTNTYHIHYQTHTRGSRAFSRSAGGDFIGFGGLGHSMGCNPAPDVSYILWQTCWGPSGSILTPDKYSTLLLVHTTQPGGTFT